MVKMMEIDGSMLNDIKFKKTLRDFLYEHKHVVLSGFSYRVYYHGNALYLADEVLQYTDLLGEFLLVPEKLCGIKIAWFKPETDVLPNLYFSLEDEVFE